MRVIPWLVGVLCFAGTVAAQLAGLERPVRYLLHGGMTHEPPTEAYRPVGASASAA